MHTHKHVELLAAFISYEEQCPGATIDDFCRHRLLAGERRKVSRKAVGGVVPPDAGALLIKIIHRIGKLANLFSESVLAGLDINSFEEFAVLNAVYALKSPSKADVTNATLMEYTTGIDIINRMRKKGLLAEHPGEADRRAKSLAITKAGEEVLFVCYKRFALVNGKMLENTDEKDKHLCIRILEEIEIHCADMYKQHRGLPHDVLEAAMKMNYDQRYMV